VGHSRSARSHRQVRGMCLGLVYVLGGKGLQMSNVAQHYPVLTKLINRWVHGKIPEKDFPYSSLQINFNYKARKHVDGNNIGPSFIGSLGNHTGGKVLPFYCCGCP
jgi:hypothetical protein